MKNKNKTFDDIFYHTPLTDQADFKTVLQVYDEGRDLGWKECATQIGVILETFGKPTRGIPPNIETMIDIFNHGRALGWRDFTLSIRGFLESFGHSKNE